MRRANAFLAVIVFALGFLCGYVATGPYELQATGGDVYRINRLTGTTWRAGAPGGAGERIAWSSLTSSRAASTARPSASRTSSSSTSASPSPVRSPASSSSQPAECPKCFRDLTIKNLSPRGERLRREGKCPYCSAPLPE